MPQIHIEKTSVFIEIRPADPGNARAIRHGGRWAPAHSIFSDNRWFLSSADSLKKRPLPPRTCAIADVGGSVPPRYEVPAKRKSCERAERQVGDGKVGAGQRRQSGAQRMSSTALAARWDSRNTRGAARGGRSPRPPQRRGRPSASPSRRRLWPSAAPARRSGGLRIAYRGSLCSCGARRAARPRQTAPREQSPSRPSALTSGPPAQAVQDRGRVERTSRRRNPSFYVRNTFFAGGLRISEGSKERVISDFW